MIMPLSFGGVIHAICEKLYKLVLIIYSVLGVFSKDK